MKIGDVIATALCARCDQKVEQVFYGDGGNQWRHDDGKVYCRPVAYATPEPGTERPVTK